MSKKMMLFVLSILLMASGLWLVQKEIYQILVTRHLIPEEPLMIKGVYALVRHPLYLFTLMSLWFNPLMTARRLGLVIGAPLYFALGSVLEAQKMVQQFGEEYRNYQKRVPWMIPFLKWPVSNFYSRRKIK